MTSRRLARWLAGALAALLVAATGTATALGGLPTPSGGLPTPSIPGQAILSGPFLAAAPAPSPALRVVELPGRLTEQQFQQVVEEIESSTPTRRTVLVAPSFVAMTSPPTPDLVAQMSASSGPDSAAMILTSGGPASTATFNAAALLYARIPQHLLIGPVTLQPGRQSGDWSVLQRYFAGCSSLCAPLSRGQAVSYPQLRDDGGEPVRTRSGVLTDLAPAGHAGITWERLAPQSATGFAPLFPSRRAPARRSGESPAALLAALLFSLFVAAGLLLRLRARARRPASHSLRPRPPRSGTGAPPRARRERPTRQPGADRDALLAVIGAKDVVDAPVRSGFSPEGYVEIDDCLVRATWSDPSPPPQPGQTVTARLVNGALHATYAGASTPRTER